MDSLFDPTRVPVGVTINKLNLAPNRNMPRFVRALRNRRGFSTSKPYVCHLLVSFLASISLFHRYTLCCIHMGSCKPGCLVYLEQISYNQLVEWKAFFDSVGITSSESCFPNSGCKTLEQKFIFQIGTLSCYSHSSTQHHNCLRNVPLYFKIIQFNIIIKKKKVTATFSHFRLGLELETKQDTPPTK